MRQKYKKILLAGTATALAGVLGISALLTSHLSVQASPEMMPGIETIVQETSKEAPFRILEIVDNHKEAEIGWYVSGQEPYIKLYSYSYTDKNGNPQTMTFSTLKEALSKLPTKALREEFANNFTYQRDEKGDILLDENGNKITSPTFKDVTYAAYTGTEGTTEADYPLSYTPYQEKYFLGKGDGESEWERIDFSEVRTEKIKGEYVKNPSGTGNYTKEDQSYYPIREDNFEDDTKDKEGLFRENIKNFLPSESPEGGGNAPYHLVFQEIVNEDFNKNLGDLRDPNNKDTIKENPIWKAYDYTEQWDAKGDSTLCYGYGYYENKYEALTQNIVNKISSEIFPGENPTLTVNGKEVSGIFTPEQNLFGSGTITVPSDSTSEEPVIEEDSTQKENAFGDGETTNSNFSDMSFSSEAWSDGEDISLSEAPSADVSQNNEQNSELYFEKTEEATVTEEEILWGLAEEQTAGTQKNPYIYLAERIPDFPFFKYRKAGDLQFIIDTAIPYDENNPYIPNSKSLLNISINKNGQYLYWTPDELNPGNWISQELFLVTGRQPVAYEDLQLLPKNVLFSNYYFKVVESHFCCKKEKTNQGEALKPEEYKFYGWYYPVYPENEPQYIQTEAQNATHYISDAKYKLTPGSGDYDFVPNEDGKEYLVEIDHLFYRGGYKNHDWFKKYVFNLKKTTENNSKEITEETKSEDWNKFVIEVTTMLPDEFEEKYGDQTARQNFTDEIPSAAGTEFTDNDVPLHAEIESTENALLMENTTEEQNNPGEIELFSETETAPEEQTSETEELFTDTSVDFAFTTGEAEIQETDNSGTEKPSLEMEQSSQTFTSGEKSVDTSQPIELKDFDLIYINGKLTETAANAIAEQTAIIPCIINQEKAISSDGTETDIQKAFQAYLKKDDKDSHYVSRQIYFFKNTEGNTQEYSLLNLQFHRNFNPEAEEGDNVSASKEAIEGFEEILEYIEKENQYRQIGNTEASATNTAGFTDGTQNSSQTSALTDGTSKSQIPLLNNKLSQARAIEYIINYKHRRNISLKKEINVLEIQPAKSNGQVSKEEVLKWLGYSQEYDVGRVPDEIKVCCEQGDLTAADKMTDNDTNTIWHSSYKEYTNSQKPHDGSNHCITITNQQSKTFFGIQYMKRPSNNINGVVKTFKVKCLNSKNEVVYEEKNEIGWMLQTGNYDCYIPKEPVENVKTIEFEICKAGNGENNEKKFASCAELRLIVQNLSYLPRVNITTMTSSEFVGHIEDINTKYDMIYLGNDDLNLDNKVNFRPNNTVLYFHTGKNAVAKYELQGLMDHDYRLDEQGKKTAALIETEDPATHTVIGSVRGSGNDITKEIKDKLVLFAKSGAPIIVSDNIYSDENKNISTELVDSSSYIYDFLNEIKTFSNVYREVNVQNKENNLAFFANLPKPKLVFKQVPPSALGDKNGPSKKYLEGSEILFEFQIQDEAQISPAYATYNCELYLDLNCDGNYSRSEKMEDILIRQNGKEVTRGENGEYNLLLNSVYTVSRTIPTEYIKLLPWKLVVTSNDKPEIKTSEIGYTKRQKTGDVENTIKVLQIMPTVTDDDPTKQCNWNLSEKDFMNYFNAVQEDFTVQINSIDVDSYERDYCKNLQQYNMLIIGFCDGIAYSDNMKVNNKYKNFTEKGVKHILDFANTGKSVIFAHDNTSSSNYDRNASLFKNPNDENDKTWHGWAYWFNKYLRPVSGMDRYGITDPEYGNILKQAKDLSLSGDSDAWNKLLSSKYDMAFSLGTNKIESYSETHGFTNAKLCSETREGAYPDSRLDTNKVSQVNTGAITEYPYKIDTSFSVATTHPQYYQLAMEEDSDKDGNSDIVVWYCLGDKNNLGNDYYGHTPNDVRNNYYIYSYKNIIYTGVGHSSGMTEMEKKLFVNTIIAAYNAQAVNPNLSFVNNQNMDAPDEEIVYYTLDHSLQSDELLFENQEFFLKVTDNNLVGISQDGSYNKPLELELEIDDPNSEGKKKLLFDGNNAIHILDEQGNIVRPSADGKIYLNSGHVYKFTLTNLQQYLKLQNGEFKGTVNLYAKVSCKYSYYGEEKTAEATDYISINQRHLFDLD